ncbi:hypothetical protein MMC07_000958 [Pseudocyphellaria aurata]|nr:hypothetical protein [Pseudocyphellaria aurata]
MPSITAGNSSKWGATSRAIARQVRGDDWSDREPWSAPAVVGAPITAATAAIFAPTRPHLGKVTPASPRGPRNRRRIQSLLTGEFFTITTAPKRPKRLLRSGPIGADQLRWRVYDEYPWRCRFVEQWAWERVEAIEEIPTPITQSGTPATPTEEERGPGILPEIIGLITPTPNNSGAGILPEVINLVTPTTATLIPEIVDLVTPTTSTSFPEIVDLITPTTTATNRLVTPAPFPEIIDLVAPTTPTTFLEIIDLITPTTAGSGVTGAADDDDRASPELIDLVTPTTASTYDRP